LLNDGFERLRPAVFILAFCVCVIGPLELAVSSFSFFASCPATKACSYLSHVILSFAYTYMHTLTHIDTHTHTFTHTHTHTHTYTQPTYTNTYTNTRTHIEINRSSLSHTHRNTYTHTHTHTHTHTQTHRFLVELVRGLIRHEPLRSLRNQKPKSHYQKYLQFFVAIGFSYTMNKYH
jgi:outer membrane receptor protein involved in Fe transport